MSSGSGSSCSEFGTSDIGEGLMSVVRPAILQLDSQIEATKGSQILLSSRIQELAELLHDITQDQPYDLDIYARKLDDSRRRVTTSGKILDNVQERLTRLQQEVVRTSDVVKSEITSPVTGPSV